MKKLKYFLILFVFTLVSINSAHGQRWMMMKTTTDFVEGRWGASDGNRSYEFELKRDTVYIDVSDTYYECVIGKIRFYKDGILIRETEYDETKSILFGSIANKGLEAHLSYTDYKKKVESRSEFIVDSLDHSKAVFRLTRPDGKAQIFGWEGYNVITDIPRELEFTRIE